MKRILPGALQRTVLIAPSIVGVCQRVCCAQVFGGTEKVGGDVARFVLVDLVVIVVARVQWMWRIFVRCTAGGRPSQAGCV
jgi:hypothetical protein